MKIDLLRQLYNKHESTITAIDDLRYKIITLTDDCPSLIWTSNTSTHRVTLRIEKDAYVLLEVSDIINFDRLTYINTLMEHTFGKTFFERNGNCACSIGGRDLYNSDVRINNWDDGFTMHYPFQDEETFQYNTIHNLSALENYEFFIDKFLHSTGKNLSFGSSTDYINIDEHSFMDDLHFERIAYEVQMMLFLAERQIK